MLRSIVFGFLLALPVPTLAQDGRTANKVADRCERPGATLVSRKVPTARVRKLGDLPPANQYLTVLRSVDNCPQPVVLRKGIGERR